MAPRCPRAMRSSASVPRSRIRSPSCTPCRPIRALFAFVNRAHRLAACRFPEGAARSPLATGDEQDGARQDSRRSAVGRASPHATTSLDAETLQVYARERDFSGTTCCGRARASGIRLSRAIRIRYSLNGSISRARHTITANWRSRWLASQSSYYRVVLSVSIALAMAAALTAEGPVAKAAVVKKPAPRTAWGDPDLTGIWTGSTITPLERPSEFAGKEFLTEQEAAGLEKRALDARADGPPPPGDPGTYNQIWFDPASKVVPSRRTSLIVDPRDGRIPFTAAGRAAQTRSRARYGKGPFDSWLDLDTGERCLTDGLPLYFAGYNNNYQFFQSPSSVVILHELYHEARVIYTDGRPHANIRHWLGDSRGRWEGNTLVVDTINFAAAGKR